MDGEKSANWREDRKLVLHVLDANTEAIESLSKKIDSLYSALALKAEDRHHLDKRITAVELKSGVFGTIGGVVGVLLVLGFEWLKNIVARNP